jgi:hypothetical protein
MVLDWLSARGDLSVQDLIARKKYAQAIEILRAEHKRGAADARVRLQLADVLVLAGKSKEAVPILVGLADEFAKDGFAAKAISVLKKVLKIDPTRADADVQLAALIKQKQRDAPPTLRPAAPELDEIGIAAAVTSTPAAPALTQAAPAANAAPPPGEQPPAAPSVSFDTLGDELLGVIEQVLQDPRPRPALAAPPAEVALSPLFSSFSEDELVAVIRGLELLSFEPGDVIITEGESGDSLFVLSSGVVKAFARNARGKSVLIREMSEGAFFGEISILAGKPRTATVTAKTRCELLELDRARLDSICVAHPHVRTVLQQFHDERVRSDALRS